MFCWSIWSPKDIVVPITSSPSAKISSILVVLEISVPQSFMSFGAFADSYVIVVVLTIVFVSVLLPVFKDFGIEITSLESSLITIGSTKFSDSLVFFSLLINCSTLTSFTSSLIGSTFASSLNSSTLTSSTSSIIGCSSITKSSLIKYSSLNSSS